MRRDIKFFTLFFKLTTDFLNEFKFQFENKSLRYRPICKQFIIFNK